MEIEAWRMHEGGEAVRRETTYRTEGTLFVAAREAVRSGDCYDTWRRTDVKTCAATSAAADLAFGTQAGLIRSAFRGLNS